MYNLEAMFWEHLGVRATDEPLDEWPEEKVRRYAIVMEQVALWQNAQQELAIQRAEREARRRR